MSRIMNSYEYTVSQAVTVSGSYNPYEPNSGAGNQDGLGFANYTAYDTAYGSASAGSAWSSVSSKPIQDVLALKRAVANQIGIRPNSMVLGTAVFDQLLTNAEILERIKYTSADSIDTDVLARYFGLERGLRVAEGRYLAQDGSLQPVFPSNGILLFYSPSGPSDSIMPAGGANAATPAFAYTCTNNIVPFKRVECVV